MSIVLYKVDVRRRATLYDKLIEQRPERAALGERSFEFYVDDNARHHGYVFLHWESLSSAQNFLDSVESRRLVQEWPIEEVIFAIPLFIYGRNDSGNQA